MDQTSLEAQQDALRPLRMFVGAIMGAVTADQTYAGQDGYSYNPARQYQVVSPYGVAVEGAPIAATRSGGLYISPMVVMLGIGAAAVLLMKN